MKLLDGKLVSEKVLDEVKIDVDQLKAKGITPKLAVVLVGDNPASLSYIQQKKKACEKTGIEWEQIDYEESVTHEKIIETVKILRNFPLSFTRDYQLVSQSYRIRNVHLANRQSISSEIGFSKLGILVIGKKIIQQRRLGFFYPLHHLEMPFTICS